MTTNQHQQTRFPATCKVIESIMKREKAQRNYQFNHNTGEYHDANGTIYTEDQVMFWWRFEFAVQEKYKGVTHIPTNNEVGWQRYLDATYCGYQRD